MYFFFIEPWIKVSKNNMLIVYGLEVYFVIPQIPKYIPTFRVSLDVIRPHFSAIHYDYFGIKEVCLLDCTFVTCVDALRYFRAHTTGTAMLYYDAPRVLDFLRVWTLLNQLICFDYFEELVFNDWVAEYSPI